MSPASVPNLLVSPANLQNDWDQVFATYWYSWSHPLQALGELTFPHVGTDTPAERRSFERLKQSYLSTALAHPSRIHWVKCVDVDTSAIIGGACYEVYSSNPYRAGKPKFSVDDGFEDSTLKVLSETMYGQLLDWRVRLMSDAHILGTALWVIPTYRSQGASEVIFDYLKAIWDKLDLEAYMEGTVFSSSIAVKYGFLRIAKHVPKFGGRIKTDDHQKENRRLKHAEYNRIVSDIQANPVTILWRPKHSKRNEYLQRVTAIFPWEKKPRLNKLS